MKFRFILSSILIMISSSTFAEEFNEQSWWSSVKGSLSKTWQSQNYELYIPINTRHNRHYYTQEKIDEYNENPWGLGIGKYRFDENGDWHALYAIAFSDSHSEIEPVAGYAFQKVWRPTGDVRLGVGYTLGVTLRQDEHYLPIPVIAPLCSVAYKKLAVQSTYILGSEGNGNILFTWIRWQLD